jgi:hypothetical protein
MIWWARMIYMNRIKYKYKLKNNEGSKMVSDIVDLYWY